MKNGFRISTTLPAEPKAVYKAWLSGREHSAMTGGRATASAKIGSRFTAWDGYISGKTLKLKPHWCIIQSWRSTQFSATDPDSRIELHIHSSGKGGSKLLLIHSDIPPDQVAGYKSGWVDHYFEPMKQYFAAKKPAKKPAKKKSARKKKAAKRRR